MGDVFLKLLNMSITASWLILAVLCIRLIFRNIPKWVNCVLWSVAAIRLICPFSIESQFSLMPSTEPIKSSTIVEGELQNYIPSIDSHLTIVKNTINPMLEETFAYNESESAAPLQVASYIAGIVWIGGMILLAAYAAWSMIRLHNMIRESVCYRDNIYLCDAVKSPFILGFVRPRVYLSSALSEKEMNYILAHESAHLKRKDHLWKSLGYLLLCIYWFNPLCWAAYIMLCKDIELACDEKVIKNMAFSEKKEYSKVLLSCTRQKRFVMAYPLAFGEVGVKERVRAVLQYKKPAFWMMIAAMAVCVIIAVCFLTNPPKEYQIRITIPAGSTETFCYSDAEISPKGNTLTIYAGEGLGDTEIKLLPVKVKEENAYDENPYLTPGMPVKMEVEKGAWFKIGVNVQNPTNESKDVYVSVNHVDVRIADSVIASVNSVVSEFAETESMTQEEIHSDMMVSNVLAGSEPTAVSKEDAAILRAYIEAGEWKEGTTDCLNNCELGISTEMIKYHSDCGTFNNPANNRHLSLEEADKEDVNAILEKYISLQMEVTPTEKGSLQNIMLYEQPEVDKVCIKVQPSMIREQTFYYYIPADEDQKWLSEQIKSLNMEGEPWNRRWEGHKERGWQIIYNDMEIRAFEGGYLYYTYNDEEQGIMECFIEAPKLCDYIQIMLIENIGYQNYDVSHIKNIVSAKLDVNSVLTGGKFYSQTITDAETLQKFEEWFSNAEYILGGTDCGNQYACLELMLANGDVVRLSMATDSCSNFSLDGVAYDYRPVSDWDNREFFKCFNEIPWEY